MPSIRGASRTCPEPTRRISISTAISMTFLPPSRATTFTPSCTLRSAQRTGMEQTRDWRPVREELARKHGLPALLSASGGGQFTHPDGQNFGGNGPSWSHSVVAEHLPGILGNAEKVAFVEWHTGLGKFGELCYICFDQPGSAPHERVFEWMGRRGTRNLFRCLSEFARSDALLYWHPLDVVAEHGTGCRMGRVGHRNWNVQINDGRGRPADRSVAEVWSWVGLGFSRRTPANDARETLPIGPGMAQGGPGARM